MHHHRIGLLCALFLVTGAGVQERTLPDAPGRYSFAIDADSMAPFELDPAARQAAVATVERLNEWLRAAAVMREPRGFDARAVGRGWATPLTCPGGRCPTSPVSVGVALSLQYFVEGSGGQPVAQDTAKVTADVYTNAPFTTVGKWDRLADADVTDLHGRPMYYQPRQTGTFANFPLLGDNVVAVTKVSRLLWLPVTREAFLRAAIRDTEAKIAAAGADAASADALRGRLGHLRAELDPMPTLSRLSQAWHITPDSPLRSGLAAADAPGARPVVVVNPDFLDRSLPRTTVQIITVRLDWGPHLDETRPLASIADTDHVAVRRLWQLVNQLDWPKLATMMADAKGAKAKG